MFEQRPDYISRWKWFKYSIRRELPKSLNQGLEQLIIFLFAVVVAIIFVLIT